MDGGDGYQTRKIYTYMLYITNYTLKMVIKIVNFMLYVFYHYLKIFFKKKKKFTMNTQFVPSLA